MKILSLLPNLKLFQTYSIFCGTKKIFWKMLITKQFLIPIDYHSIFFLIWKSVETSNIFQKCLLLCSTKERNSNYPFKDWKDFRLLATTFNTVLTFVSPSITRWEFHKVFYSCISIIQLFRSVSFNSTIPSQQNEQNLDSLENLVLPNAARCYKRCFKLWYIKDPGWI